MLNYELSQRIYASNLKSRAVLVANYLIFRSNKENTCFPAIKTIAREIHVSVNTVKRALNDLVEAGFVKKEARFRKEKNGAQTSNLFTICDVELEAIEGASGKSSECYSDSQINENQKEGRTCNNDVEEEVELNNIDKSELLVEKIRVKHDEDILEGYIYNTSNNKNKDKIFMRDNKKWATPQPILIPP